MQNHSKQNSFLIFAVLGITVLSSGCLLGGKKKKNPADDPNATAEPDKILYERAEADGKKGRYTEERLSLQTLINTYPDSEYLAKAKLSMGDSYFKEGGTTGLTESVAEYKDFITFFPFLDEASYAQMQVGMAHYRMMEKPDRDRAQALLAEDEFQTFLLKYPQSPLAPKAEQKLREVQEIIAEGDFAVARFYYIRGGSSDAAAASRLLELTSRYPLFSQGDQALWMLGNVYSRHEKTKEQADQFYARIVRDYPLSHLVDNAKNRLTKDGVPVPQADPTAVARMREEQNLPRHRASLLQRSTSILRSGPDVSAAARTGQPNLNPPADVTSATEVLQPGAGAVGSIGSGGGSTAGSSVAVETVPSGSAPAGTSTPPANANPPGASGTPNGTGDATAAPNPSVPTAGRGSNTPPAAGTTAASGKPAAPDSSTKNKKESSSKKKKGLRKIIPW
ncbi:MAG: outer membrane protein assembly factor BamD [Candidatus Acidiferrales bacterium]